MAFELFNFIRSWGSKFACNGFTYKIDEILATQNWRYAN